MENNVTISVSDFCEAMRRSLEREADLLADRKELELQAKASGINVSAAKKWLKAEVQDSASESPKRVAKLIAQTVDQVVYGESLGHDLGMFQNNEARQDRKVENNSNPAAHPAQIGARAGEADEVDPASRTASPTNSNPATFSPPVTGGTADSPQTPAVPPTHSNPAPAAAREAGRPGEGDAETVTASSAIQTGAAHACDDGLEIPEKLKRANWVDGSPPR